MNESRITAIVAFLMIAFIFGYAFWSYENPFWNYDNATENRQLISNVAVILLFIFFGQFAIRKSYKSLKDPNSPWRSLFRSKLFYFFSIIFIITILLNEFSEQIAEVYNFTNEPPNYEEHYGALAFGVPIFFSVIILLGLTYYRKFSDSRSEMIRGYEKIQEYTSLWDKIKHNFDAESRSGFLLLSNSVFSTFNNHWFEFRQISKLCIMLTIVLVALSATIIWQIYSTTSETPTDYVEIFATVFFSITGFIVLWGFFHNSLNEHEDFLLWFGRMKAEMKSIIEAKKFEMLQSKKDMLNQ